MTEIDHDGGLAVRPRETATMGYPLPPAPPRYSPEFNHVGQYLLPSPSTGRPTAFTRTTTVSKTLSDTFKLSQWVTRGSVQSVVDFLRRTDDTIGERLDRMGLSYDGLTDALLGHLTGDGFPGPKANDLIEQVNAACGGKDAAELGEAVHAWLEALDIGQVRMADIPEMFRPYVVAYRLVLARHALVPVPEYVERIVLNDSGEETIVGTLDRIYRIVTTGELVLGDVKTSKTLDYSWLEYAVQLVIYRMARLMLTVEGEWERMPDLIERTAYLIHVPSDQPERAACVTYDMEFALEAFDTALHVRDLRRRAKREVPSRHAIPTPSPEALRYVEARHAIQDISDPAQLAGLWEEYQDVWSPELTTLGETVAALFE